MKKTILMSSVIVGFGMGMSALATVSQGVYIFLGGGGAFLSGVKLDSVNVMIHGTPLTSWSYTRESNQKTSFDSLGHVALGYFFNPNPEGKHAFGLEGGFNNFGTTTSTATDRYEDAPESTTFYTLTSAEKSNAWSTTLAGVFAQQIFNSHLNLLLKLGVGYENMAMTINNTTTDPLGLPTSIISNSKTTRHGIGAVGGVGLQYNLSSHVAIRAEVEGMKGGHQIGYASTLVGLVFSF